MANVAHDPKDDLADELMGAQTLTMRIAHELRLLQWSVNDAHRHLRRKRPDVATMAEHTVAIRAQVARVRAVAKGEP